MATEPNTLLLADPEIPRITIAGKEWPVPSMAPAQLVHLAPIVHRRHKRIAEMAAKDDSDAEQLAYARRIYDDTMTTETLQELSDMVFWGLRRGHPHLSREEFDNLSPVSVVELLSAAKVIAGQTHLFREMKSGETRPLALTPAPTSPSTGESTGPTSQPRSARARAGRGTTSGTNST